ncbi:MAG: hypothetical protein HOP12_11265 [Candidatus Eisenbacteria bacterium]|uniref:Molybdopterin molybdenumtransferase n=1 Tax=Eiseniibacteriota bacterium TaxID=2212470 RepID=A0A849SQ14_UNCEI|nr:hypothetical protein [Candidatus Eisenbacteria bacterium]
MLASLAAEAGAEVVAAEHAGDDATEVSAALQRLLASADIVLSIGGVSEGDFDPVKQSLAALGGVARWSVAMKPGKPQAFGAPNGRLFFGLPGNPASVACVFEVLVRPALRAMQGFGTLDRPHLLVRAAQSIESRAGRRDYVRAALEWRDGVAWAHPAGAQISGHLAPQSRADGLVVIHESLGALAQGESAEFMVLRWGM